MTFVLLHGVPETAEIWDDVRAALGAPSVALRLPGFGCPRPDGFSATKDAYVEWLAGELRRMDQPVDLVGHDWGAGLTLRIGTKYPELVRSWAFDVPGIFHPEYEWHDIAKVWQTPGEGEAMFENAPAPEDMAPLFRAYGLDESAALKLARMSDPVMGTCILDLYRSATPNPYADWPDSYAPSTKPCLALLPTDDPFTGPGAAEVVATLGAQTATLPAGHFWPLQVPELGAKIINEFVGSLG